MHRALRDRIRYDWLERARTGALIREFGIPATVEALADCLREANTDETLACTCCFLRDSVFEWGQDAGAYRAALEASAVPTIMHERLLQGPPWMRAQLVYTMKIGLEGNKQALREAFFQFRDTDPLLMPALLCEAGWTCAMADSEFPWLLLESPSYLSRWAVAECVPDEEMLAKMADDPHPRVRREALYLLESEWLRTYARQLPRSESKRKRREIEAFRLLTFSELSIRFWNHQHEKKLSYYTVEELSVFEQSYPRTNSGNGLHSTALSPESPF